MKDKEIQLLIGKYLDGATTPEEEKRLATELMHADIPEEWEPIRLMLGELTLGEATYDRIMAERQSQQSTMPHSMKWRWAAIVAVAASLVIILLFALPNEQSGSKSVAMVDETPTKVNEKKVNEKTVDVHARDKEHVMADTYPTPKEGTATKTKAVKAEKAHKTLMPMKKSDMIKSVDSSSDNPLYEDTLGNSIWKDERKVIMAMEMLGDCERTIVKSKKAIRNGVVEASFNALPQRPNIQLVIDEEGNYFITEDTQPSPIAL